MSQEEYINYYKEVLPMDDEDFKNFVNVIGKPLRGTLAVRKSPIEEDLKREIEKFPQFKKVGFEWLQNTYMFEHDFDKMRTKNGDLEKFANLLVTNAFSGTILRQDVASMVPVTLLGASPNSKIISMTESRGRRVEQLLEVINKDGLLITNSKRIKKSFKVAGGNEYESHKRITDIELLEEVKFPNGFKVSQKPSVSHIVTKNDARTYPDINVNGRRILFDGVLCSVPSSKDGIIRERPENFKKWKKRNYRRAESLFNDQVGILTRAVDLAKKEKIIVYTCDSLDPIECEAVVQKVMHIRDIEIVDFRCDPRFTVFPKKKNGKLTIRQGLTTWVVREELRNGGEHMMPDTGARNIELEKCIRIHPQDQDTVGLFIAVIRNKMTAPEFEGISTNLEQHSAHPHLFYFPTGKSQQELKNRFFINDTFSGILFMKITDGRVNSHLLYLASENAEDIIRNVSDLSIMNAGCLYLTKTPLSKAADYAVNNLFYVGGELNVGNPTTTITKATLGQVVNFSFGEPVIMDMGYSGNGIMLIGVQETKMFFCGYGLRGKGIYPIIEDSVKACLRTLWDYRPRKV